MSQSRPDERGRRPDTILGRGRSPHDHRGSSPVFTGDTRGGLGGSEDTTLPDGA